MRGTHILDPTCGFSKAAVLRPSLRRARGIRNFFTFDRQVPGTLSKEQILATPSTPICSPSYPRGPYHFKNREYFIVAYESDPEIIRRHVPKPLKPASNVVLYEWIKMPDSTGFGDYEESGTVIPCLLNGKEINYTAQMFLDCEPPIAAGREIWGFPKKYGEPSFTVDRDTIVGTLNYSGQLSATGTMSYKYREIPPDAAIASLTKPSCNLKLIPDVNFGPKVAQLIGYQLQNVKLKGAWEGPARLQLIPHANSPTADLPVRRVIGGKHYLADILLPYGEVLYDYIANNDQPFDHSATEPFNENRSPSVSIMPPMSPSYSPGHVELGQRQHFSVLYQSNVEAIRSLIPDKLFINDKALVIAQWTTTTGNHGLGKYNKFDWMVPVANSNGKQFHFLLASFLDSSAPITLGREVFGQPQKFGFANIDIVNDTLNGTLKYSGLPVAVGTMPYKQSELDVDDALNFLMTPRMTLKLIPNVQGDPQIAQLYQSKRVSVSSAYKGHARLHLNDHVNAPISDLAVERVLSAYHINCSEELHPGRVEHDYL